MSCVNTGAAEGRDYADIEKTVQTRFDLGERGERVQETIEHLHQLAELGVQVAHGTVVGAGSLRPLEPDGRTGDPCRQRVLTTV